MPLPNEADQIVIHGYLLDELSGAGVQQPITSVPVALPGQQTPPMLLDAAAHAYILTGSRSTTPNFITGYFAFYALSTNDPDLHAYGGRQITLPGQPSMLIAVPHDAPLVTVTDEMSEQIPTLLPGGQVRALWLDQCASYVAPTPLPAFYSATQVDDLFQDLVSVLPEYARDALGVALVNGSNISITPDDAANTITISVTGLSEVAQDATAALIAAGAHSGISFAYNDAGNALSATVAFPVTSVNGRTGAVTGLAEQASLNALTDAVPELARDAVGAALVQGNNVLITVDDVANTIRIDAAGGGGSAFTAEDAQDTIAALIAAGTHSGITFAYDDAANSLSATVPFPVSSVAGKTGTVTLVKADVGLGNVDNTSDAAKPVSTATQTALDGKSATGHTHAYAATSHTHPASDLTATGTRDATTYLRGDNTWATAGASTTPTATKTAAYTAAPGELVMVDATSGPITITAPATGVGRVFGVKKIDATANVVTVARAGSDTIGSELATSVPIRLNDQATHFLASGSNWVIPFNHLSLLTLDGRYAATAFVPSTSRTVTASTTAVAGEQLAANAASGAITVTPPASPAVGARVFLFKSDTSANKVLWSGTVSGDTGGLELTAAGAGATLVYTAAGWWVQSTTTAAVGRTGTSSAPASAGPRNGTYDPLGNRYAPSGGALRAIRGHLARAAAPTAPALVDVCVLGDSRTAGSNIPSGTPSDGWPSQVRARLTAAGIPSAGTGLVMASNGNVLDSRIVLGGSWTNPGGYMYRSWTASGATATFTSDTAGSVVDVYYYTNSGTFTVKVGAAAAVPVTPAGGGTNVARHRLTGQSVTAGTTITVSATSASGFLIGFCVSGLSGVLVHPVAVGGFTTTQLAATGSVTPQQIVNFINPSIVGLMAGAADPFSSISSTTTAANLATILNTNNGSAARFLVVESPIDTQASVWPSYVSAQYDAADTYGLPLLDINDRYVSPALGNAAGLLGSDLVHENVVGCLDLARAITNLLTA